MARCQSYVLLHYFSKSLFYMPFQLSVNSLLVAETNSSRMFSILNVISLRDANLSSLQACDSEEDGLFAFDMHSDGSGQRYPYFYSSTPEILRVSLNEQTKCTVFTIFADT